MGEITKQKGYSKEVLVQGFQDYVDRQSHLCPDNVNLMEIFPQRKFDRISNIMDRAMREGLNTLHSEASSTATETFLDTVVDLGLYSLMWVGYIKDEFPEEYQRFLTANNLLSTDK